MTATPWTDAPLLFGNLARRTAESTRRRGGGKKKINIIRSADGYGYSTVKEKNASETPEKLQT